MNRKNLTTAVLAGLAGAAGIASTAQAVNLNPDHIGQVLIYPYYTVNNDNLTLLSVVNTSDEVKAVKVRFLEGQNSQEVLDFNLYMSPYDVWVAAIADALDPDDGEMKPHLQTADNSCTVPYLWLLQSSGVQPQGQKFVPFNLIDKGQTDPNDFEDINPRGREGHFEMITMGTVTDLTKGSATAATHVEKDTDGDGAADAWEPADCAQLNEAWTFSTLGSVDDYWLESDGQIDMQPPGDGVLFGGGTIVNVAAGYAATYDARALNGWTEGSNFAEDGRPLHQFPGNDLPSLNSGNVLEGVVFLADGSTLSSGDLDRPIDAVSFVFMHDQIFNEYNTDPAINGTTEWVMTFPTKRWYVDPGTIGGTDVIPPFTDLWDELDSDEPDFAGGWGACEIVELHRFYDREERTPGDRDQTIPPIVSPRPPDIEIENVVFPLCFETSVIEFVGGNDVPDIDDPTGVLGSINATRLENNDSNLIDVSPFGATYNDGWVGIDFTQFFDAGFNLVEREDLGGLLGLPVTGFSVNRYGGDAFDLPDGTQLTARYGGIFQHKGTRLLSSD